MSENGTSDSGKINPLAPSAYYTLSWRRVLLQFDDFHACMWMSKNCNHDDRAHFNVTVCQVCLNRAWQSFFFIPSSLGSVVNTETYSLSNKISSAEGCTWVMKENLISHIEMSTCFDIRRFRSDWTLDNWVPCSGRIMALVFAVLARGAKPFVLSGKMVRCAHATTKSTVNATTQTCYWAAMITWPKRVNRGSHRD